MPVAVVTEQTKRFELKSCPGGFIVVKRMTYGQKLQRQEMAMKMRVTSDNKKKSDFNTEIDMMNRKIALWSLSNLIEQHNLEDANGRELNFKNPVDVEQLAAPIGEEIEARIDELNNFEEDEALGE